MKSGEEETVNEKWEGGEAEVYLTEGPLVWM